MMIKEIIVVEGRDDEAIVKKAVDADIIRTNGYAYGNKLKNKLKKLSKERGIIIFTDPDYMGKKIRRDLSESIPDAKHAFLPKGKAIKGDDIGVENANVEDIKKAIADAKPKFMEYSEEYDMKDMIKYGLSGKGDSKKLRMLVSEKLGIEYGNAKNFVHILNSFKIDREDLERALEEIAND